MKYFPRNHRRAGSSRSPHGERGLKFSLIEVILNEGSRSPHGERGLKLLFEGPLVVGDASLPTRGAWIEIGNIAVKHRHTASLPTRGAWIEIISWRVFAPAFPASLPSRGAWIEIKKKGRQIHQYPSLPTRGAWIEIWLLMESARLWRSLPTRGAWIEITGNSVLTRCR